VALFDDGDAVAEVAVNEERLGPGEAAEAADRERGGCQRCERAPTGRLLADTFDDLRPQELGLLQDRLVDSGVHALRRGGEQVSDLAPRAGLRQLDHAAPVRAPSARSS